MTDVNVSPLLDEGLGNSAYLLDLGGGRALAVDASRDLRAVAERRGLRIAYAADTHLHADLLSGARDLAAGDGARVLASGLRRRRTRCCAPSPRTRLTALPGSLGTLPPYFLDSVSIPLRGAFATWLGWLVDPGRPLAVVRNADQDPDAAGGQRRSIPSVDAAALARACVLDIRQTSEFAAGHVPGARNIELGGPAAGWSDWSTATGSKLEVGA